MLKGNLLKQYLLNRVMNVVSLQLSVLLHPQQFVFYLM